MKVSANVTAMVLPGTKEGLVPLYVDLRQPLQKDTKPSETAAKKPGRKPKAAKAEVSDPNTTLTD
jgi:hypothetical protein